MKSTLFVFGIVFATLVSITSFAATQSSDESLRQVKELFDRGALHLTMRPNCVKPDAVGVQKGTARSHALD